MRIKNWVQRLRALHAIGKEWETERVTLKNEVVKPNSPFGRKGNGRPKTFCLLLKTWGQGGFNKRNIAEVEPPKRRYPSRTYAYARNERIAGE